MKANVIFKFKVSRKANRTQEETWSFRIIQEEDGILSAQFWFEHGHQWEYFFAPGTETLTDLTDYLKSTYMFQLLQTGAMGEQK